MTIDRDPRIAFAGIGVQKSASGWVFRTLEAHPGIATPVDPAMKEANYFNNEWHLGHGWYEGLFPPIDDRPRGEFSVLYALNHQVPERMRRYNPDLRLILCLRDPIDRAFSQHRYLVGRGLVPDGLHGFMDAWSSNPSYEEQSTYAPTIERFRDAFSEEQLLIVDYDDVAAAPDQVLERVLTHLGVDPSFRPASTDRRYNQSRRARGAVAGRVREVAVRAARALPGPAAARLRRTGVAARVNGVLTTPVGDDVVPPLRDEEWDQLADCFADDVHRVRSLTDDAGRTWLTRRAERNGGPV